MLHWDGRISNAVNQRTTRLIDEQKMALLASLIGSRSFYMGSIIVRPPRRRTHVWISSLVVVLRSFQISRDALSLIFFLALPRIWVLS
jgi:hypothetical protein